MRTSSLLSLLSAVAASTVAAEGPETGERGNATVVVNNPPGVVYAAKLPKEADWKGAYPDGGNAKGSIAAVANPNGIGVLFKVTFSNLPKEGGPFTYHLHEAAVPEDGNCTKAKAHLDPFVRGDTTACDKALPQTCQVGDLSGKHGAITSDPFTATYLDEFASTANGNEAFFGDLSFVLHFANKTRITCANFEKAVDSSIGDITTEGCAGPTASATSTGSGSGSGSSNSSATAPSPTGPTSTGPVLSAGSNVRLVTGAAGLISFAAVAMFWI